jgi:hypothetical protein
MSFYMMGYCLNGKILFKGYLPNSTNEKEFTCYEMGSLTLSND